MVNTIWKSSSEIARGLALSISDYPNVTMLAEYETIDELTYIAKNFCLNICKLIDEAKSIQDESLISSMLEYIRTNYTCSNFSIQNMADHFDMTLTNISQYFKNHISQTIIEYTTNLRMEEAKKQLLTSDMSINEIASHIGYLNTSSFIRRFKQITGLTPGQYVLENKNS